MSTYELIFVVEDVGEGKEVQLIDDDINLLTTGRLQRAYVEASGDSFMEAVEHGLERLERHGVRVRRLYLDLVTKSEIAERTGVSKPTVGRWTKRAGASCFPQEDDWGVTGPLWAWGDVNEWLRRNREGRFDGYCTLNRRQVDEANEWLRKRPRRGQVVKDDAWAKAPHVFFETAEEVRHPWVTT